MKTLTADLGYFPTEEILKEDRKREVVAALAKLDVHVDGLADLILGIQDAETRGTQFALTANNSTVNLEIVKNRHALELQWLYKKLKKIMEAWDPSDIGGSEARVDLMALLLTLGEKAAKV